MKVAIGVTTRRLLAITAVCLAGIIPAAAQEKIAGTDPPAETQLWKAGVARTVITPGEPMWMAGYAARDRAAEGKLQDLWAKALALEDAGGRQVLLITLDLLGLPKGLSDKVRDELESRFGLTRAQVLLNSSHTHSGPVVGNALSDIYPLDAAGREKIIRYSAQLEEKLVQLAGEALRSMEPARLSAANGVTRFQVNRRNNDAATLHMATDLNGPNDYAVPVIRVENAAGKVQALVFGYACHPTVLSGYDWCGDYAGFAQEALEKEYPGATALFFQGAGADQNPLPRHTVPLARQYGFTLAAAVDRVLHEEMRVLPPELRSAYKEIALPLESPPSKAELSEMAATFTDYNKRWARRLLDSLEAGRELRETYPYPLQVWMLGGQPVMSLGGELTVEYAIDLKQLFGHETFVMGYSNDVMAYIPSEKILSEGGYEGESSQRVYGLPAKWAPSIQSLIITEMTVLAETIGLRPGQPASR